jgi:glycosyltransferase involved in cell wall biosynthesis
MLLEPCAAGNPLVSLLAGSYAGRMAHPVSISVVIPVKDDGILLRECLLALHAQSRPADEVIVVDNGSVDDSASIAAGMGARVVTRVGGGIPAASAAGYDATRGDVIARLDADCIPSAGWLARIARDFEEESLVAVTGPARFIDGPRVLRPIAAAVYLSAYFGCVAAALGHIPVFGSNFAFRRGAWLAVRSEVHSGDAFVHDDLDLSIHLGPGRRIRFDPRLGMGMSMRALQDRAAFAVRMRRGMHSIRLHWPAEYPWLRWQRRWQLHGRQLHGRT